MSSLPTLLPPCWTAIAERPRTSTTNRLLHWHGLADAPLYLQEAHELAAKGAIIMAQRYLPDRVELLVRPAMDRSTAPGKPNSVREGPVQKVGRSPATRSA